MPCEILVVVNPKVGITEKGYPWVIKDTPAVWGSKEGLPNWVIVRIADATKAQVENYLTEWYKDFIYTILNDNVLGYRIKVEVDPALVSTAGVNRELRVKLKDYLVNVWGAVISSYTNYEVVVDILKPVSLQEVKKGLSDIFKERMTPRRYYFSSSDVDLAVANGGLVELTKAQVLSRIKDKLEE